MLSGQAHHYYRASKNTAHKALSSINYILSIIKTAPPCGRRFLLAYFCCCLQLYLPVQHLAARQLSVPV